MIMFSRYIYNFLMLAALSDLAIAKTNSQKSLRGAQFDNTFVEDIVPAKRRRKVKKSTSTDPTLDFDSRVKKGDRYRKGKTGIQSSLSDTLQTIDGQIEEAFSHQGIPNNHSDEPTHIMEDTTHESSSMNTQNDEPSIKSDTPIHDVSENLSTEPSLLDSIEPSISPSNEQNDPSNKSDTPEPTTYIYSGSEIGNTEPTALQSNEPSISPPSIHVDPETLYVQPSILQSNKPSASPSLSPSNANSTRIDRTRSPTIQQIACIDKQTYGCDVTLQNCCEGVCREDVGIDSEVVTLCFPMECVDLSSDGCDTDLQNCCEGFCNEVDDLTKDSMKTTKCQITLDAPNDVEVTSPHLTPLADPLSEKNPIASPLVAETMVVENPDTAQSLSDNCIQLNTAGCDVESQNCCTGVCKKCEELGVAVCLKSPQQPSLFPSTIIDTTSTFKGVEVSLAPSPGISHSLREPSVRTNSRSPTIFPTWSIQPSILVSEESSRLIPSVIPSQFPSSEISRSPSLYPTSTHASVPAVANSKFQASTSNSSADQIKCIDIHAYGCSLDTQNCCGDGVCIDEVGLTLCVGKLRREHLVQEEVDADERESEKEDELCIALHDRGCDVTAQNCCHGVCRKHNGFGKEPITQCDFL